MTELSRDSVRRAVDAVADRKAKVDLMLAYSDRLLLFDIEHSFELAGGALDLASSRKDRLGAANANRSIGRALLRMGRAIEAVAHLRTAARHLEELDEGEIAQAAARELAEALEAADERSAAITQYEKILQSAIASGDLAAAATLHESIGRLYTAIGDHRRALKSFLASLELRESIDDSDAAAQLLIYIGAVYGQLGEYRRALEYFNQSLAEARGSGNRLLEVQILVHTGRAHYSLDELQPALENAFKALEIFTELEIHEAVPEVLGDIGSIYERRGDFDAALMFHLKALRLLDANKPDQLQVRLYLSVANLYNRAGLHREAQGIAAQTIELVRVLGDRALEYQLHLTLSASYQALGDYHRALEHHQAYASIREEHQGTEMQRSILELQMQFDVERSERQREIYRLKAEQLEADGHHRAMQLTAMAANLVQKNQLLDELTEQITLLVQAPTEDMRKLARTLLNRVAGSRHSDQAWQDFERQLALLHGDFINRLTQRFPTLAPVEIKVCSLLKLGLPNKQIAELMGIVLRTVENHRYNIRRKIDPELKTNLVTLLTGI